jgi:hypothetical protein
MPRLLGIIASLLIAVAAVSPASTLAAESNAKSQSFEVGGVHLGMTPTEVTLALSVFDPRLKLQTQYYCGNLPESECFRRTKSVPIGQIVARTPAIPINESGFAQSVTVMFSSIPGRERVVAVTLERDYAFKDAPAATAVAKVVSTKFPSDSIRRTEPVFVLGYFLDRQGQSVNSDVSDMTDESASMQHALATISTPDAASYRMGVAFVGRVNEAQGVAASVQLCLYDEGNMYQAAKERERFNEANLAAHLSAASTVRVDQKF